MSSHKHFVAKKYLVLLLASSFYLYEFFLRVSPSVMTDALMKQFSVAAGELSLMSAAFFYAYMPMQIIAGLLGDHFGPKKLLTVAVTLCAMMTILFVVSDNIVFSGIARFFIGMSASCAYIAPLMLAGYWFHERFFPMISGFIQLLGSFGAYLAGAPFVIAMQYFSWQYILLAVATLGLLLAVLIYNFVQDQPSTTQQSNAPSTLSLASEWQRLKQLCRCSTTWLIAFTGFAFWAPMSVFAELWGPAFLVKSECVSLLQASLQMKWLWIGVAVGGPVLGYISHKLQSCRLPMMVAFVLCLVDTLWLVYGAHHSLVLVNVALFLFGFSCSGQCLTFGLVRQLHTTQILGTAIGFTNMAVILGGTVLQPLAGLILDLFKVSHCVVHTHTFSMAAFHYAFSMMPVISTLGFLVTLFYIKEYKI